MKTNDEIRRLISEYGHACFLECGDGGIECVIRTATARHALFEAIGLPHHPKVCIPCFGAGYLVGEPAPVECGACSGTGSVNTPAEPARRT